MKDVNKELQETLLLWSIWDDHQREQRDRQAGRESFESIQQREALLDSWLKSWMRTQRAQNVNKTL